MLEIFDGVDFINVTVFGYHLEPFFGCSANEFEKYVVFYYVAIIWYCQKLNLSFLLANMVRNF